MRAHGNSNQTANASQRRAGEKVSLGLPNDRISATDGTKRVPNGSRARVPVREG